MYRRNVNGLVDFNYEVFILNFFNYYNLERRHYCDYIINLITDRDITMKEEELRELTGYTNFLPSDFRIWTREEKAEWLQNSAVREREYNRLFNEWYASRNITEIYFGVSCTISCSDYVRRFEVGDIIASEGFDLQPIDGDDNVSGVDNVNSHYVFVTEVRSDGTIIVSSWGYRYIFDNSNSNYTTKVLVRIRKMN